MIVDPPRLLGTVVQIRPVGMVFPWKDGQPALLSIEGSDLRYLPLFDDREQLEAIREYCEFGFGWDSVKMVKSLEFIELFKGTDVRLIANIPRGEWQNAVRPDPERFGRALSGPKVTLRLVDIAPVATGDLRGVRSPHGQRPGVPAMRQVWRRRFAAALHDDGGGIGRVLARSGEVL